MSHRVRVLHPITRMIVGGAQLNTLYTCRLMDRDRFDPVLLTGPQLGTEGDLLSMTEAGVPVVMVDALRREINPWHDLRAYRSILAHLNANDYLILHTHTSKAGILAREAAHRGGVPVIIHTAHGWQWTHARGPLMNRMIIAAERRVARYSDRIIVVAEKDREKGLAAGVGRPEQYVLIESAIPLDDFDPASVNGSGFRAERGIPGAAPVVGTVGRFAYQKAPEVMLKAALRLLDLHPDLHFVYVGDGPLKQEVLAQLDIAVGMPRLHLVGIRGDVPSVLAAMDVFLLSSRYEGLPRVAVEAMAMGKPVVSTPADGVVDVVKEDETGHLVAFENSDELAAAASSLLNHPQKMRAMGDNARRLVLPRFDLRRMVRRIEEVYKEVLEDKGL